MKAKLK